MDLAEENLTTQSPPTPSSALPTHLIPDLDTVLPPPPDIISPIINIPPPSTSPHHPHHTPALDGIGPISSTSLANRPILHIIPEDDIPPTPTVLATSSPKPEEFTLSSSPFGHSVDISLPTKGLHPTLGLSLECHDDNDHIIIMSCIASTPAARIPRWRSTLRQSILVAIDHIPVTTLTDVSTRIATLRSSGATTLTITLIPKEHINIRLVHPQVRTIILPNTYPIPPTPTVLATSSPKPEEFTLSSSPFGHAVDISLPTKGLHPTLGLSLECHDDTDRIILTSCIASTPAARVPRWRSTLMQNILVAIDHIPVTTLTDVSTRIATLRSSGATTLAITLIPKEHINIR
eukprot:CAMPEP_0198275924 /NCGR_PEP_ID=MMETSP1447-20131203/65035_1 /TAXON_ID=420782 /ORGANISM="Chaetoceros dichaeta, Strain CCMP1751" /LENGTH=347 /DNA_ID=CAMNT_0043970831 /DNA_START=737 /DNA_END=1776 /DNA_ORIENTATION=+